MNFIANLFGNKAARPTATERARGAAGFAAKSVAENLALAARADSFDIFCRIVEPECLVAMVSAFDLYPLGIEKPDEFNKFMLKNKCEDASTSRTPKISRTANNREELLKGLLALQFHVSVFNLPPGVVLDRFLAELIACTSEASGCSSGTLNSALNRYIPLLPQTVVEWKNAANPLQRMNPSLMSLMQFEDPDPEVLRSWVEVIPKSDFSISGGNAMFGLVCRNNGILGVLAEVALGKR